MTEATVTPLFGGKAGEPPRYSDGPPPGRTHMNYAALVRFIMESNAIEGVCDDPVNVEIAAHVDFLEKTPTVESLERFLAVCEPGAALRRQPGVNIIGAPLGGPEVDAELRCLLAMTAPPYERHLAFMRLQPFTSGNGRAGRVLWLHNMGGIDNVPFGFLSTWYSMSLSATG